jgi:hypothetical protein
MMPASAAAPTTALLQVRLAASVKEFVNAYLWKKPPNLVFKRFFPKSIVWF